MKLPMRAIALSCVLASGLISISSAAACPFCTALEPSLCQLRDQASEVALAEFVARVGTSQELLVHTVLKGKLKAGESVTLPAGVEASVAQGSLLLVFGGPSAAGESILSWSSLPVSEAAALYFAKAPSLRVSASERLKYFISFLEHADPQIARDAYFEIGSAPFEMVDRIAGQFSMATVRAWLVDPHVPQDRKGLYGLAAGLARSAEDRRKNQDLLANLIAAPADDFRAGFDGVLGGYLLLTGQAGLEQIETKILRASDSREGDLRHALTALRFYRQYGHAIPAQRLNTAVECLLDRPSVAAGAIVDLARAADWNPLEKIAGLYANPKYGDQATRYAIVGYLLTCPEAAGTSHLNRLRRQDPDGVAEAERQVLALHSARQ